eukprot:1119215-Pelagomonas_calceolata.AAC.8
MSAMCSENEVSAVGIALCMWAGQDLHRNKHGFDAKCDSRCDTTLRQGGKDALNTMFELRLRFILFRQVQDVHGQKHMLYSPSDKRSPDSGGHLFQTYGLTAADGAVEAGARVHNEGELKAAWQKAELPSFEGHRLQGHSKQELVKREEDVQTKGFRERAKPRKPREGAGKQKRGNGSRGQDDMGASRARVA